MRKGNRKIRSGIRDYREKYILTPTRPDRPFRHLSLSRFKYDLTEFILEL